MLDVVGPFQRFNLRLLLLISFGGLILTGLSTQAKAVPIGAVQSMVNYNLCEFVLGTGSDCDRRSGILTDMFSDAALTSYHIDVAFDPNVYVFDPDSSGPVCSFADGGNPCLPAFDEVGTFPIQDLPLEADGSSFSGGTPLPGSLLSITTTHLSPTSELVSVDYILPFPIFLPIDQSVFFLAFDVIQPLPGPRTATYFDTPGVYDFTQISSSCGLDACGAPIPIYGFNINENVSTVPEPSSIWLLASGILLFSVRRWVYCHWQKGHCRGNTVRRKQPVGWITFYAT
jgi:hypothetical protein